MNLVKNLSPFGKFIAAHLVLLPLMLWAIHVLAGDLCNPNNLSKGINFDTFALYAHAYSPMVGAILTIALSGLFLIELYEAWLETRWQEKEK